MSPLIPEPEEVLKFQNWTVELPKLVPLVLLGRCWVDLAVVVMFLQRGGLCGAALYPVMVGVLSSERVGRVPSRLIGMFFWTPPS